jgi:hypothetical protein
MVIITMSRDMIIKQRPIIGDFKIIWRDAAEE